jgi:putative thioredoxin
MSPHTVEAGSETFEAVVIEGSKKTPVVVDFWAPWCGPCRALTPILEKLAAEYGGRFVLAKVNSDENPELSARYGVRGIPSVKAFWAEQLVDEFTGALPEKGVREFLDRLLPSPADELRDEAARVYSQTRDIDRALAILDEALQSDPENEDVLIDRAALLVEEARLDEARRVIEGLKPLTQMGDRVSALNAKLDLARGAGEAPSEDVLTQRIAVNDNDLEARLQLAHLEVARKRHREALEQLLEIVRRDRGYGDDAARKTMLKVFELLGNQGELVSEFRRKLASAMN